MKLFLYILFRIACGPFENLEALKTINTMQIIEETIGLGKKLTTI